MSSIDVALDLKSNKIINLNQIEKNHDFDLVCIDCKNPLILKHGEIKIKHLSHKAEDSKCSFSNGESEIHKQAKKLLIKFLESGNIICFSRTCNICFHKKNIGRINVENDNYNNIIEEYKYLEEEKTCIADIALLKDNIIKLIIEIKNTHSTKNRNYPWVEFDAKQTVNSINTCLDNYIRLTDLSNRNKKCVAGNINCMTLKEIAIKLGYYIDYSEDLDLLLSVSCCKEPQKRITGKWQSIEKPNGREEYKLFNSLFNILKERKKCLKCKWKHEDINYYRPFCLKCYKDIKNAKENNILVEVYMEPNLQIRELFKWLLMLKECTYDESFNDCLICKSTNRKIWYYGYRLICIECMNEYKYNCYNKINFETCNNIENNGLVKSIMDIKEKCFK
jgi:hypothetical protein